MRLYIKDNFVIVLERYQRFFRFLIQKIFHVLVIIRDLFLRIFRKDIRYFTTLFSTTKKEWKHDIIVLVTFVCFALAWWFYNTQNIILSLVFLFIGMIIYLLIVLQTEKKIKARQTYFTGKFKVKRKYFILVTRKTKTSTKILHNLNSISLGTLHFGVALPLWSGWVTNKQSDNSVLVIAIFFSLMTIMFFIAVYSKPLNQYLNSHLSPFVISLSFLALFAGFLLGIFEALPNFPQTSFTNQVIVQIVLYFGFAWIVTILLAALRDVGNSLIQFLILVFLFALAIDKITQNDPISKISSIFLFGIFFLGYSVLADKLTIYGEAFEK